MTPKDLAVRDIQNDLSKQGKTFLAFHNELNPAMRKLVSNQIKEQAHITNPLNMPIRYRKELVARCFFCNGQVELINYSKYYANK
jgi:hypothetical protein